MIHIRRSFTSSPGVSSDEKAVTARVTSVCGLIFWLRRQRHLWRRKQPSSGANIAIDCGYARNAEHQFRRHTAVHSHCNYSDGSTKNLTSTANWLSSSTSVATVNTTGLATGASGGTTTISASFGGVVGSTTLTVVALQSITVTPNPVSLAPNNTQQF